MKKMPHVQNLNLGYYNFWGDKLLKCTILLMHTTFNLFEGIS